MIISHKELINLPAETRSGQNLGRICGYEVDADTQRIVRYHIKSLKIISDLLAKELIVHADQVISLTPEKIVVEDNVVKSKRMVQDTVAPITM